MTTLLGIILYSMGIWILLLMLWQGLNGSVDFLSMRNFALLGFVVFQLISGGVATFQTHPRDFVLVNQPTTAMIYLVMVTLFLGLFFLSYNRGWVVNWLAWRVPVGSAVPKATSMLTLAFVFLGVGLMFRVVFIHIPVAASAFFIMGSSMLAVAAGMAAWVWGGRMFNPVIATATAIITLLALAGVLHTDFGRRAILGVVGCFGWGAYHGHWKHLGPKAVLIRLGGVGLAALIFLAAFTATRSGAERSISLKQKVSMLKGANVKEGVSLLLSGQDAGRNSMWFIENYPSRYPYRTLHTARYFLSQPIPRIIFPNKPDALGRLSVPQANADKHRASNYSVGPGIIGHISVDNPFIALPLYAVFGGLFIGFLDRLIRIHPDNPFVILPLGTTLGQIVGLARGETGLFLFQATLGIAAAWIGMYLSAKGMSLLGWRIETVEDDEYDQYGDGEDQDDDWRPDDGPEGWTSSWQDNLATLQHNRLSRHS